MDSFPVIEITVTQEQWDEMNRKSWHLLRDIFADDPTLADEVAMWDAAYGTGEPRSGYTTAQLDEAAEFTLANLTEGIEPDSEAQ